MQNKTFIKEIFTSIQGEGPYIGVKQLFIRFSKCNLNCIYCDTDFKSGLKEYSPETLYNQIKNINDIHSISLTGAEPLLDADFLLEFLPLTNKKIYLETNATLVDSFEKIVHLIDIAAVDLKLDSSSKNGNLFNIHKDFIDIAIKNNKEIFLKVVFDENITQDEIHNCIQTAEKNDLLLVLQPKWLFKNYNEAVKIYNKFTSLYNNVRLIPQVHKYLNIQ